jgi:gliding motility-associated-like protein
MLRTVLLTAVASSFTFIPALAHDHDHDHGPAGLEFHENKGQWPAQVLYRAKTGAGAVFVERNAFTYVITSGGMPHGRPFNAATDKPLQEHAYRVHFEGGMATAGAGLEKRGHYVNYFLGDDRSRWASGVSVFSGVELTEVYPGIGLHVDGHNGLKYDWVLRAGVDPATIVMRYEGQDGLRVADGLLYVSTSAGEVIEQRPVAWQMNGALKVPVRCAYVQQGDRISYAFPDGLDATLPLVIDPTVVFSSYSGSFGDNFGFTATYDDSGHLYGGGMVRETGYPVTLGVVQATYAGPSITGTDMGISKFSPDGTSLVWSTYVGGSQSEVPHSLVVNSADELFILGTTNSSNFPLTVGCFDNTFGGGITPTFAGTSYGFTFTGGTDIVVVHLNSTATEFIGSTFVGGSGNDGLNEFTPTSRNYGDPFRGEIILDDSENPIIATSTSSSNLFTSSGAAQSALSGGQDGYIFRMDPALTTLDWATYYGGSGVDACYGVQVSSIGEVYVSGGTTSSNLPMSGTGAQNTFSGVVDGFIARLNASTAALLSSTYVGTSGYDQSYFVQLDVLDDVYVVGQTTGVYPISPGRYNNPNGTQFIHKFAGDLGTSLWSTRIGSTGSENISPSAFLVSNCGQIYFSGWAGSTNQFGSGGITSSTIGLPVTADAYQSTTDGSDFYLIVLNQDAVSLEYATFFGGSASEHVDGGTSRFDKNGIVYQAVCAGCGGLSFPTTPGVHSSTNNSSNCNLGVFKIDFEQNVQVTIDASIQGTGGCVLDSVEFNAVGTATEWIWDLGDGSPQTTETSFSHLYEEPGVYTVTLIGTASGLCVVVDTATVEITVLAPAVMNAQFDAVPSGDCDAFQVEFFNLSTGSTTYFWQFGDGTFSQQTNPVHSYVQPGTYDVVLTVVDPICRDTVFSTLEVEVAVPGLELELASPIALCDGASQLLSAGTGFDSYLWSTGETSMMITVDQPGTYTVEVTDGFCTGADTIVVIAQPAHSEVPDKTFCPGDEALVVLPDPVTSIVWSTGSTDTVLVVNTPGIFWFDAIDLFGCDWTDTLLVTIIDTEVGEPIIPNVFSPNGDASNDVYLITGVDADEFELEIYNRWGMKVFTTTSVTRGWNGKLDNGSEPMPEGTYYYVVTYKDDCAQVPSTTLTGHITLLR